MKEFLKKEIHEKTTIGKIVIESLIYAAFLAGIAVYGISMFSKPNMQMLANVVNDDPITIYFILLPVIIILVECITLAMAMLKIPTKKESTKKKTTKKKSKE